MTYYREGQMRPTNCEECDCAQYYSDLVSWSMTRCRCGHAAGRHIFRPAERTGEFLD